MITFGSRIPRVGLEKPRFLPLHLESLMCGIGSDLVESEFCCATTGAQVLSVCHPEYSQAWSCAIRLEWLDLMIALPLVSAPWTTRGVGLVPLQPI